MDDDIQANSGQVTRLSASPAAPEVNLGDMEALAHETGRELSEIEPLYREVFFEMKSRARLTEYLTLFVAKKVKYRLHERHTG